MKDQELVDIMLRLGVISVKIDTVVTLLKELVAGISEWQREHQEETEVMQSRLNTSDPSLTPKDDATRESLVYQMNTTEFRTLRDKEYAKHFR